MENIIDKEVGMLDKKLLRTPSENVEWLKKQE